MAYRVSEVLLSQASQEVVLPSGYKVLGVSYFYASREATLSYLYNDEKKGPSVKKTIIQLLPGGKVRTGRVEHIGSAQQGASSGLVHFFFWYEK